jgi:rSAM/selenodomain-associated transferase 1
MKAVHRILGPNTAGQVSKGLCALGIMTKAPRAGEVKTRLSPPLTAEEAAMLNVCFLRDLARSIATACTTSPARGVGVYTPLGSEADYESILPPDFFLIPQRGNAFGERLIFAAEDLFNTGFESVCLINSDSPTVPASSFAEAAKELSKSRGRVVLGPSGDGGYYLIGLKQMHRRLVEEIDWITDRVLPQTLKRAAEIDVEVHQLPSGFDVDDRTALRRLCNELLGAEIKSTIELAPNTRKFLSAIVEREGRDRIWAS